MKRHLSDNEYFKLLRMLDDFAQSEGVSINDDLILDNFIDRLSAAIKNHRDNPIRVYGFRVESMFAHIAAALGKSQILTEEDSGAFFSVEEYVRRPDFRIVITSGEQLLVEVKNFHQKDPMSLFPLKSAYFLSLKRYAEAFNIPLKIATFWSVWNLWTLVDAVHFNSSGKDYAITLPEAMKRNEMNLLGDHMVGTTPPLSLRLYADKAKPRSVNKNNQVHFTIGRATILAGGKEITDEYERKLVWFFMLHGKWEKVDQPAEVKNGLLEYTEFSISPEQYDKKQGFAMLGYLSQLITSNYKFLTSPEGEILQLTPKQQPDQLSVLVPPDYKGKTLKLWRFHVKPNFEDLKIKKDNHALAADRKKPHPLKSPAESGTAESAHENIPF